jgi:hypothetical protein
MNWDAALIIVLIVSVMGLALAGFALYMKYKEEKKTV